MKTQRGVLVGTVGDGVEVRRLDTDGAEPRYCLVGHSHWVPAWFFARLADEAETTEALLRQAGVLIAGHEGRTGASGQDDGRDETQRLRGG